MAKKQKEAVKLFDEKQIIEISNNISEKFIQPFINAYLQKEMMDKEIKEKYLKNSRNSRWIAILIIIFVCLLVFFMAWLKLIQGEAVTGLLGIIVGGVFGYYFPKNKAENK